jgi:hypothetical protein
MVLIKETYIKVLKPGFAFLKLVLPACFSTIFNWKCAYMTVNNICYRYGFLRMLLLLASLHLTFFYFFIITLLIFLISLPRLNLLIFGNFLLLSFLIFRFIFILILMVFIMIDYLLWSLVLLLFKLVWNKILSMIAHEIFDSTCRLIHYLFIFLEHIN